jgi:predicted XRE-type DNA-binding protein
MEVKTMNKDEIRRQQAKTREQRFLNIMEQEFNYPPKIAQAILAEAQDCLQGQPLALKPGQMRVILLSSQARHGRALGKVATREVTWTVDAGQEDRETEHNYGRVALRQARLQRLLSEAVEQGAMASQEDVAQVLQVSVRTIKRDCQALQARDVFLPTRGNLKGLGRGQSHKAQIVGRWLQGQTYDQVAHHSRHSLTCVKRYVQSFLRVVSLQQKGFSKAEISLALQIGQPLVADYLKLYEQNDSPFARQRLAEHLQRLANRPTPDKRGVK